MVGIVILLMIALCFGIYIAGMAGTRAWFEKMYAIQKKSLDDWGHPRLNSGIDPRVPKITKDMIDLGGFFWIFTLPYMIAKRWFLRILHSDWKIGRAHV